MLSETAGALLRPRPSNRPAAPMNVGVFGGAFDPPHVGHVELARRGIDHFGLDRLLVQVVEDPGHKKVGTAPETRLHLAKLAFEPLDEAEVALDPHPRTVDSLRALGLDDPVFLIGADEFATFPTWTLPDSVLRLARLGVATRPGVDTAGLEAVRAGLELPDRVTFFEIEPLPVSSSDIRARLAAGLSVEALVPPAVAAEIARLGLYAHVDPSEGGGMLRDDRTEGTTQT